MSPAPPIKTAKPEIEAKFLLWESGHDFRDPGVLPELGSSLSIRERVRAEGARMDQGYFLPEDFDGVLEALGLELAFSPSEIRLRSAGDCTVVTCKGKGDRIRAEVEHDVSAAFFETWWPSTEGRRVEKVRWKTPTEWGVFEFDDYVDRDLLIAEVELADADEFQRLPGIGKDVTSDIHYKNFHLATAKFL